MNTSIEPATTTPTNLLDYQDLSIWLNDSVRHLRRLLSITQHHLRLPLGPSPALERRRESSKLGYGAVFLTVVLIAAVGAVATARLIRKPPPPAASPEP